MDSDVPLSDAETRLAALVRRVRDLPALPAVAQRVMQLADDPRASAADVAKTLSTDQAMTARVLKLANSSFYGLPRRVSTVTESVLLLGMRTLRNMAMAAGCRDMLTDALPGYGLRQGELWRHSLCCAYAAQALAARARYRVVEEAFIGGLLHDVGKVVLNTYLQDQFDRVLKRAIAGPMAFMDAEREILGFDHAQAGARVLEKWNLPAALVECVRHHHDPLALQPFSPLVGLVHVADILCLTLGIGLGGDGLVYPLQPGVLQRLNLTDADFEQTAFQVSEITAQSDRAF